MPRALLYSHLWILQWTLLHLPACTFGLLQLMHIYMTSSTASGNQSEQWWQIRKQSTQLCRKGDLLHNYYTVVSEHDDNHNGAPRIFVCLTSFSLSGVYSTLDCLG